VYQKRRINYEFAVDLVSPHKSFRRWKTKTEELISAELVVRKLLSVTVVHFCKELSPSWDSPSQRLGGTQGIQQLFSFSSDQVLRSKVFDEIFKEEDLLLLYIFPRVLFCPVPGVMSFILICSYCLRRGVSRFSVWRILCVYKYVMYILYMHSIRIFKYSRNL